MYYVKLCLWLTQISTPTQIYSMGQNLNMPQIQIRTGYSTISFLQIMDISLAIKYVYIIWIWKKNANLYFQICT